MAAEVTLRAVADADSDRLLAWRNAPQVAAYMYADHVITPDEHARWFAGIPGDARRAYWIIAVDGTPAGLANFYDIDRTHGRAAWAYYIADPGARGRGVGSYVEYWMIEQAFGPMGLRKLWCEVLAANEPVLRLHRTFGFTEEARLRGHVVKGGQPLDVVGLGLLADEWAAIRPAMAGRLQQLGFIPPTA
jgi:UDP-4-amino-4,6-dideoxy-N-acetyl-beta-L-altrosamine N-acetyltransferase